MKVAFLGLGTMGYLIAGRLASAGVDVCVYNRTGDTANRWSEEYGKPSYPTPAAVADGASLVISCLSDDAAVSSVLRGTHGAFSAIGAGAVVMDHSTGSADLARDLSADAAGRGFHFLDAPVTGGKPGAAKGALTCMVGGDEAALDIARPILSSYTKAVFHVGPAGAGQIAKMANQICIGGIVQSLAEALGLIENAGLDSGRMLEALRTGSARSWQMDNRGPDMVAGKYDFGFAVELLAKDVAICLSQAARGGLSLPTTTVTERALRTLVDQGYGHEDVAALMRLCRSRASSSRT